MIHMHPSLPCDISFLTGKGNLKRDIPVQPVYNKLGHRRAWAICRENLNKWCFKVFMACDDDILNALESLRHRDLSQNEYDQLERFVCQLYKSKVLYNTLFSREENFAKSEFEIFSREDIFANIVFTRKYLPAKISSRENILSRKYLPAKISSRENSLPVSSA